MQHRIIALLLSIPILLLSGTIANAGVPQDEVSAKPLTLLFTGNVFGETDPCGG